MTKIAVTRYKAFCMFLYEDIEPKEAKGPINKLKQPSEGYYYASDVCEAIRRTKACVKKHSQI